jgi:hypothetical protein
MIFNIFGAPNVSWMDFNSVVAPLNVPMLKITGQGPAIAFNPPMSRFIGDFRFVFVKEARALPKHLDNLTQGKFTEFVLVSGPRVQLEEYSIPIRDGFSMQDVNFALHPSTASSAMQLTNDNTESKLLDALSTGSLLGTLHQAFYQIEDKVRREKIRVSVYEYLSGVRERRPTVGVNFIDKLLTNDRIPAFRQACLEVGSNPEKSLEIADRYQFDSFEIMYTLKKSFSL